MQFQNITLFLLTLSLSIFAVPDFDFPPTVVEEGNGVRITFSVKSFTDVAVYAEDTLTGKIIAHIAAGVLGLKAPYPLVSNSLTQSILWDKKTDKGEEATSYEINVGLGLAAQFVSHYGWNSRHIFNYLGVSGPDCVSGMEVDKNGDLIVQAINGNANITRMWKFSRSGDYLETIHPYSGKLSDAQTEGFGRIQNQGGTSVPVVYNSHTLLVIPEIMTNSLNGFALSPQGWLVVPCGGKTHYGESKAARVVIMGTDGTCPRTTAFGPKAPLTKVPSFGTSSLGSNWASWVGSAVTSDGKYMYYGYDTCVYKGMFDSENVMTKFAGSFKRVSGLAVDVNGRVYVADWGLDIVRIFDSNGVKLDSLSVKRPFEVKVHGTTGAIYVGSADSLISVAKIQKFDAYPVLDSISTYRAFGSGAIYKYGRFPRLALDAFVTPARIWLGPIEYAGNKITCIIDNGNSFTLLDVSVGGASTTEPQLPGASGVAMISPKYIAIDPDETVCYAGVKGHVKIDLASGAITKSRLNAADVIFSPDGSRIIAQGVGGQYSADSTIAIYDRNENITTWPNGQSVIHTPFSYFSGPWVGSRGMSFDKDGNLFVLTKTDVKSAENGTSGTHERDAYVFKFSPEGNRVADPVFHFSDSVRSGVGGLGIDKEGNIFTMCNVRPRSMMYPSFYTGKWFIDLESNRSNWEFGQYNNYAFGIGSLFKFKPAGGNVWYDKGVTWSSVPQTNLDDDTVPGLQIDGYYRSPFRVENALWQYFGVSPVPNGPAVNVRECQCMMPRLGVDGFGRVFAPDAFRFNIVSFDNNGNEILRFGEYGNCDDIGGGSSIPLAAPRFVAQVNKSVYISDIGNNRVVKVALGYKTLWSEKRGIDTSWSVSASSAFVRSSEKVSIKAFPQPFSSGQISIGVSWPGATRASVSILSPDGRTVRVLAKEKHVDRVLSLRWDGKDVNGMELSAGRYFVRVTTEKGVLSRMILLVR